MVFIIPKFALFVSLASALVPHEKRQGYVGVGVGYDDSQHTVGTPFNYWDVYPNGTYDLTRGRTAPVTSPVLVPFSGARKAGIIEPSRSVFCIIDMQNYFLHPALAPTSDDGRAAVGPTVDLVKSFRQTGVKVTWVNWGLNDFDLLYLPPSIKAGLSFNVTANTTMGADMGMVQDGENMIDAGPELMAGAWNTQPYGALKDFVTEGVNAGTDLQINKNRLSALWGAQTSFGMWLQENEITTIFIAGVDADQCVRTTSMDAYFKGYDIIYVDDLAATRNGQAGYDNTRLSLNYTGFIAQSQAIIEALN